MCVQGSVTMCMVKAACSCSKALNMFVCFSCHVFAVLSADCLLDT